MQLDFAILADGAQHRPDGKLDIYGAGFDTILARAVPALHPRIVVVLRVLITRAETQRVHTIDVTLSRVGGDVMAHAHAELTPVPEESIPRGRTAGLGFNLGFDNVVFPEFGTYEFAAQWDGKNVRRPIRLTVAPQEP